MSVPQEILTWKHDTQDEFQSPAATPQATTPTTPMVSFIGLSLFDRFLGMLLKAYPIAIFSDLDGPGDSWKSTKTYLN